MAGLDPAIHVFLASSLATRGEKQAVDARVKPGHDAEGLAAATTKRRSAPKDRQRGRRRAAERPGARASKSVGNHGNRH